MCNMVNKEFGQLRCEFQLCHSQAKLPEFSEVQFSLLKKGDNSIYLTGVPGV